MLLKGAIITYITILQQELSLFMAIHEQVTFRGRRNRNKIHR